MKRYRSEFIFGLQIVRKQIYKLAQNRNAENFSFVRNTRPNNSPSDNWSIFYFRLKYTVIVKILPVERP